MAEPIAAHRLGATGPKVSAVGLGCMVMSDVHANPDEDAGVAIIHASNEAGMTFLNIGDS